MIRLTSLFLLVFLIVSAMAQDAVPLIDPARVGDWKFNNGQEFPGATGSLEIDPDAKRQDHESLRLVGDFTKGGQYVEAGRKIDKVDIRELVMWVRNPDSDHLSLRINDASGQTHQIAIKTEPSAEWQRVTLPLEQFFAHRGEAEAVPNIAKYESWGGAKDGKWHGPATALYMLLGRGKEKKVQTLWLNDIAIIPRAAEVPGEEITTSLRLDEMAEGQQDWGFSRGEEVKGAKGSLTAVKEAAPGGGEWSLKLAGDFTGGGAYVAAIKELQALGAKDVTAFHMQVKTRNAEAISVQLVDGSGQTHQRKGIKLTADGQWHELSLEPAKVAGGEHWGGANDGKWHGPAQRFVLNVNTGSDPKGKQPEILLGNIRAEAKVSVFAQPPAFKEGFEGAATLGAEWTTAGTVAIDTKMAATGSHALELARTLEKVEQPCSAVGPAFPVAAGKWEIGLACKADLNSPDNSYNAVVVLECLDGAGKVLEKFTVADVFRQRDWQSVKQRLELPKGAAKARFAVQLNKTYGHFWVDDLSAAWLSPAVKKDDRIIRILFSTAQLGNLLFPNDPKVVSFTVETRKPLRDEQRAVTCVVRDYWGAEQTKPLVVPLGAPEKKGDRYAYAGSVDLAGAGLELGRYYEVQVSIPQEGEEPFRNYTSLAILPEANTKRFKPEEIPFTSRNWDNRLPDFVRLSDRLGIRICGVWGGWSDKPPYKAEAPSLDLVRQLGMGWLTNTPAATIERGKKDYDETALREGVRNLIQQFGKERPMVINLGNEPHGTGQRVLDNVAAYKAIYEEVKKTDPSIPVVATSVEPNEEYFKAGYGKYCDAFDFHIYETSEDVRRSIGEYKALMKKYGVEKPIWSTELGLNSQGMTRQVVAVELIKKFSTFFAAGGTNMSWFCLLYPDPEGKDHGSSGDSHNVFDCRYNRYAPRLDAVAYYHAVNGIGAKKFIAEKQYAGGVRAFLFRDKEGATLQVLWKEKGRQDSYIPLTGVKAVDVIRIDGSHHALEAGGQGVTLSLTEDPLLLQYRGGAAALPETLGAPMAALRVVPAFVTPGKETQVEVLLEKMGSELELVAAPLWTVKKGAVVSALKQQGTATFSVLMPAETSAREADFEVLLGPGKERTGMLLYRVPVKR